MTPKIATTTEKIGPATAKAYLANHVPNRRLRPALVKRYAAMMSTGNWRLSHQGIAFNEDGKLCDGQHRLNAIMRSGCTVEMQVSRYCGDAPMAILDSGYSRSCGDRAMLAGLVTTKPHETIAILNAIAKIDNPNASPLQVYEIEEYLDRDGEHVAWALATFRRKQQWNAMIRGAFAYCHSFDKVKTEELARMIVDQIGYTKDSAAHVFTKTLAEGKLATVGGRGDRFAIVSKVLNLIHAHIKGVVVRNACQSVKANEWARAERVKAFHIGGDGGTGRA